MTTSKMALLPLAIQCLCLASIHSAFAFHASPSLSSTSRRSAAARTSLRHANQDDCDTGISRRGLLRTSALVGAASLIQQPSPARAAATAEVATKTSSAPSSIVSNTLCDPSVSTWVKTYDDSLRTVHLLGTAHISSDSAELAGRIVRELKPTVVFVELDAKRVARAIPGGIKGGSSANADASSSTTGGALAASEGEVASTPAAVARSSIASTPSDATGSPTKTNPFDVQGKLTNVGAKYVGNAMKGMYGKLESEGFKAGDEFAMSVREGLAIGSTIVLGDRDVEVTLQRLTTALTKTDIRKLLSADSEVNSSMEQLLPENMKKQLKQPSQVEVSANGMSVSNLGEGDVVVDKAEFSQFVETMKTKDNVKTIMKGLKSTAPEIYEAMVAERDRYMARGLDELGDTLKGSSVESTVAVVGMAHVDGIETYLADKGWKEMRYPCPVSR